MNAELLVERIIACLRSDRRVQRARQVTTIYKDRHSIAVVDHEDRIWNVHVLRDHAEHGITSE